jgi:amidase
MTRLRPAAADYAFHYADRPALAELRPWEEIEIFTEDCFMGLVTKEGDNPRALAPFPRVNPLTGPIQVLDAARGDLLAIHFASMHPARDWGVSTLSPNFGLLSGTRLSPNLQPPQGERVWIWRVDEDGETVSTKSPSGLLLRVPRRLFHGSVGVAPDHGEIRSSVVPDSFGGNLDLPEMGPGTTLYLRVNVPGAKLYVGDGHYAQGDGEIGGTAVEGAMHTTLRVGLCPADDIEWPRLETDTMIGVIGAGRPLDDAVRVATSALVKWVSSLCCLKDGDALQLVSQCCVLRVANLVNPSYTAAAFIPKTLLPGLPLIMQDTHARLRSTGRSRTA